MIDYLLFRIYDYFYKKKPSEAYENTINFLVILIASLLVPFLMILILIIGFDFLPPISNKNIKYLIGVPMAVILLFICNRVVRRRITNDRISLLRRHYYKDQYFISIWVIFMIPVFNVFVLPIIYGLLNGTLRFPFLEK